jgi:hypothetical protein
VKDACDTGKVNQSVKFAPTLSAQSFDHFVSRGYSKRHEQQKSSHSYQNKFSLNYILDHAGKIEGAIEPKICKEV